MDTEKRLLAAFALSMGVLILWRVFFVKEPPPKPPAPVSAPTTAGSKHSPAPAPAAPNKTAAKPEIPAPTAIPVTEGKEAQEIIVEGPVYQVKFSTQGALIESWVLTKYTDAKGKPLDVVNEEACKQLGFPMQLETGDPQLNSKLNSAIFVPQTTETSLKAPIKLEFVYSDGKIQARKTFTFGSDYEIRSEVSVSDGKRNIPVAVEWPGGVGDHSVGVLYEEALSAAVYGTDDKVNVVKQTSFGPSFFGRLFSGGAGASQQTENEQRNISGPLDFAGIEDQYFAGIFFAESKDQNFRFGVHDWAPADWKEKAPPKALIATFGESQAAPLKFRLFVAPKDIDLLHSTEPPLDGLLDWGWFGLIAKPLFLAMKYVDSHWLHNYGWTIVLLTVLLNVAMFPLRLKSIRSAQEMQRVAPLIKAIQDRYKQYKFNDPRKQRMNQEIMKLYQEHGVNPLGGCLPMAIQIIPIYAFWRALELPIELRHAQWILWFKDLSQPDSTHLFGLPIPVLWLAMMISSFAMTKMTPMATADPQQKKMMMFMPLVFGFIFLKLASGLVLYYLTASVVGIATQILINRKFTPAASPGLAQKPEPARK